METNEIDTLAREIAERLNSICEKEKQALEISAKIAEHKSAICLLEQEKRTLEQLIQSERYTISERLGKPTIPGNVVPFNKK